MKNQKILIGLAALITVIAIGGFTSQAQGTVVSGGSNNNSSSPTTQYPSQEKPEKGTQGSNALIQVKGRTTK